MILNDSKIHILDSGSLFGVEHLLMESDDSFTTFGLVVKCKSNCIIATFSLTPDLIDILFHKVSGEITKLERLSCFEGVSNSNLRCLF